jgi:hypothetical protein
MANKEYKHLLKLLKIKTAEIADLINRLKSFEQAMGIKTTKSNIGNYGK